jgi:hypothetical protein
MNPQGSPFATPFQGGYKQAVPVALAACALLIYVMATMRFAVDRPYYDDYPATLQFLNNFVESDWRGKIAAAFAPHNEHRLVFSHLIEVSDYWLFGQINFAHLVMTGLIGWLLTIAVFWRWAKAEGIAFYAFCPVVLLLTNFSHFELMTWAMGGNQQYYQLLFCLLSILGLTKGNIAQALAFFVASIFTGAGGFALVPIIAGYFLLTQNKKALTVSLAVFAAAAVIYFYVLPYHGLNANQGKPTKLPNPLLFVAYVLTFIGSIGRTPVISMAVGATFLALMCYFWRTLFKYKFLLAACMFIVVTAAMAAIARAHFGADQATTSRYREYSLLFAAFLYIAGLLSAKDQSQSERRTQLASLGTAAFFLICLLPGIHGLQKKDGELHGHQVATIMPMERTLPIIDKAKLLGIYDGHFGPNPVSTTGAPPQSKVAAVPE